MLLALSFAAGPLSCDTGPVLCCWPCPVLLALSCSTGPVLSYWSVLLILNCAAQFVCYPPCRVSYISCHPDFMLMTLVSAKCKIVCTYTYHVICYEYALESASHLFIWSEINTYVAQLITCHQLGPYYLLLITIWKQILIKKMITKIISKMLMTKNYFLNTIFGLYNFMIFVIICLCYNFVLVFKYCLSSNVFYVILAIYHLFIIFLCYHSLTIISSFIYLVIVFIIYFFC